MTLGRGPSWVLLKDGVGVFETFSRKNAQILLDRIASYSGPHKYELVPILDYLVSLNRKTQHEN